MIDVKNSFLSGLDLDTSVFQLKRDAYIDALNITRDAVGEGQDLVLTNIPGNQLVNYVLPSGVNICIGAYANTLRNTVIYFVYNSNDRHQILQFDTESRTITKILENLIDTGGEDVLGFTADGKITSVNVYPRDFEGDLLYFLDSQLRPTMLNIQRFLAGEYTPVTREILDVIKAPYLFPITGVYGNDTNTRSNYLVNREFQFAQLYVYDEYEQSVLSPWSAVLVPQRILDQAYTSVITNNNVIYLSLDSGEKNVKSVKLLMRYAEKTNNWSDFLVVDTIDKTEIGLKSQYRITTLPSAPNSQANIILTGNALPGDVVNIYLIQNPSTQVLAGTYTVQAGDGITQILNGLVTSINALAIGSSASVVSGQLVFVFNKTTYSFDEIQITPVNPTNDNIKFNYSFYNDSTYPVYNQQRALQTFDWVPDQAKSQDMPNGNVLAYGGVTEGYDKDLLPDVTVTTPTQLIGTGGATGSLSYVLQGPVSGAGREQVRIIFSGTPAVGTQITFTVRRESDSTVFNCTYTTIFGDTSGSVCVGLVNAVNTTVPFGTINAVYNISISRFAADWAQADYEFVSVSLTPPTSGGVNANSIQTWLWSTSRNIGIAYFDKNGKTNGILYNDKITFPAYAEDISGQIYVPYVNAKIYHQPPEWAYSYAFLFTKEATQFLFWECSDVKTGEADYLYFDVSGLVINAEKSPTTAQVLSYSFQDGDRLRLIKNVASSSYYNDTYDAPIIGLLTDPNINGVDTTGTFLKIKKASPFDTLNPANKFYVLQIYRPTQSVATGENEVYYECGVNLPVLNPGETDRAHSGLVSDQNIITGIPAETNIYNGDTYFRLRTIYYSKTGIATFYCQDRNMVDSYLSAVSSLDGRANLIDANARRQYFGAVIRHGGAYQPNTSINALSQFEPASFIECLYNYGDIVRMKARDKIIKVFQSNKTGYVPIYSQIHRDGSGVLVAQTDKLLNPIQYYVGDWGIGDAATSLASFNFADYFADPVRGAIVRSSNDGLTPISVLYKINSFCSKELPLRTNGVFMYSAYQQKVNNYVLALEAGNGSPAYTLSFDEETNAFESFLSYHPEMMVSIGTLFITFKDGQLYTHDSTTYNEFYGGNYESNVTLVFNQNPLEKKTWESITEVSSGVFDCPLIYTNTLTRPGQRQESLLVVNNFKAYENNFSAAIRRDINSAKGLVNGDFMKGNYMVIKFRISDASNLVNLNMVSVRYIDSPLTTR